MADYYSIGVVCYELLSGFNNSSETNFTLERIN